MLVKTTNVAEKTIKTIYRTNRQNDNFLQRFSFVAEECHNEPPCTTSNDCSVRGSPAVFNRRRGRLRSLRTNI